MIEYAYAGRSGQEVVEKKIRLVGIGSAGTTVLDRLVLDGLQQTAMCAVDADLQNLTSTLAPEKIQIGRETTRGLGAGGDPEVGYRAAEDAIEDLRLMIGDAEVVFVVAGLGGGTGSGVAPIVAREAREQGAMVIAVLTLPFEFEGRRRCQQAEQTLELMEQFAQVVVCFENDRMGEAILPRKGIAEAFAWADRTLSQAVMAMVDIIRRPGMIRVGMEHLLRVFAGASPRAIFGSGYADSDNRANEALAQALRNPLLDKGRLLAEARRVLVVISGGRSLSFVEVETVMEEIGRHVHDHAHIYFGVRVEPEGGPTLGVVILGAVGEAPEPLPELHPMRKAARATVTAPIDSERKRTDPLAPDEERLFHAESAFSDDPLAGVESEEAFPREPEIPEPAPVAPPAEPPVQEPVARQEVLQFEPVNRGRFEKSEPTIVDGEDLDVPTFMRKKIRL